MVAGSNRTNLIPDQAGVLKGVGRVEDATYVSVEAFQTNISGKELGAGVCFARCGITLATGRWLSYDKPRECDADSPEVVEDGYDAVTAQALARLTPSKDVLVRLAAKYAPPPEWLDTDEEKPF